MFVIAASMSASDGCGVFASSAAAAMIWPDWQYPHCGTSSAIHACCTGCARFRERPSMVVTRFPATAATGSTQVRVATPSRCTVQAPHCAIPHPNFVPVRPRLSRNTQRSGVSGTTLTVSRFPFTVKLMGGMSVVLYEGIVNNVHRAAPGWKGDAPGFASVSLWLCQRLVNSVKRWDPARGSGGSRCAGAALKLLVPWLSVELLVECWSSRRLYEGLKSLLGPRGVLKDAGPGRPSGWLGVLQDALPPSWDFSPS